MMRTVLICRFQDGVTALSGLVEEGRSVGTPVKFILV